MRNLSIQDLDLAWEKAKPEFLHILTKALLDLPEEKVSSVSCQCQKHALELKPETYVDTDHSIHEVKMCHIPENLWNLRCLDENHTIYRGSLKEIRKFMNEMSLTCEECDFTTESDFYIQDDFRNKQISLEDQEEIDAFFNSN